MFNRRSIRGQNRMSATKKKNAVPIVPPWLRQLVAMLFGPGRTCTLAVLLVAAFSGGAWAVWRHVETHVEASRDYLVRVEQISITPPPEWVRSDVRAEAFRTASPPDRPLSSLDDGLAQRIAMAFMLHPWVAKATVTKRAEARVNVDIVYRRPVCMVELANGSAVDLLPIDGEGVWLPGEDFSQKQKESYPCLAGIDHRPIQPAGHPWGDSRVIDVATIAACCCPSGNNSSSIAFSRRRGPRQPAIQRRPMTSTRERARGSSGVRPAEALPRANQPGKTRLPGSCSMRRPAGVWMPGRRWMSAGSRLGSCRRAPPYAGLLACGKELASAEAAGSLLPVTSSSRRMGRSSGASTPIRTMPGQCEPL